MSQDTPASGADRPRHFTDAELDAITTLYQQLCKSFKPWNPDIQSSALAMWLAYIASDDIRKRARAFIKSQQLLNADRPRLFTQ